MAVRPPTIDFSASRVFVGRGGVLRLCLERTDGSPPIEGTFYEDEAEIMCGEDRRAFSLNPPDHRDWIPDALAHVERLIQQ